MSVLESYDHCRIGSLETVDAIIDVITGDHCRIGSLEILRANQGPHRRDHCRIGSLENRDGKQR